MVGCFEELKWKKKISNLMKSLRKGTVSFYPACCLPGQAQAQDLFSWGWRAPCFTPQIYLKLAVQCMALHNDFIVQILHRLSAHHLSPGFRSASSITFLLVLGLPRGFKYGRHAVRTGKKALFLKRWVEELSRMNHFEKKKKWRLATDLSVTKSERGCRKQNQLFFIFIFFLTNNISSFYLETEFSTSNFVPKGFGELIQWITGLLCKHEDLNLDPEHLHRNWLW